MSVAARDPEHALRMHNAPARSTRPDARFMPLFHGHLDTPLGPLALRWDDEDRLHALSVTPDEHRLDDVAIPATLRQPLDAYFAGSLASLDALHCAAPGTTFQQRVWTTLRLIPPGTTWSYAELARAIGQPTAMRAVGAANGRNPIGIVVPCHRVIGANGTLTGYAGGLATKQWLLDHERRHSPGHTANLDFG